MDRSPLSVGPDITVDMLVKDFIYGLNRKFVIVAEDGKAFGYIVPEQIKRVLQSQWNDTFVRTIAQRFTHDTVVSPAASAIEALRKLQSNGIRHLAVLEEGNALVGTVSETNFLNYITVREELATPAKALPAEPAA
jgi:CBS domain-containing protein